ncbi:hypothetical protein [uncultured Polaribacter sp.]|uniref:hypothetical protein n=1 Tax=uncultured Polaribacter sp. TaxID=174711 RepID=UPI00260EAECF|nr:hypothetical protein [uncultured Polaribacter sp.]
MAKLVYKIDHATNNFKLYNANNQLLQTASWFLEFGKTSSEIYSDKNKVSYKIIKKFKFWQWKTSYKITNKQKETFFLNSQNKQNSLFKLALNEDIFEVKIHYYKKKSVLKNGVKIAEFNDGFLESKEENTSNLLLKDTTDLETVFLIFTCLKTGVTNQKPLLKSQKELISIQEDWGA